MALKAGRAGNADEFADSMAAAMEEAFQNEWDRVKDRALREAGEEDRRILFAAVAQGVVNYLRDHLDGAIHIDVSVEQESGNNITSSGASVSVQQDSPGNRVVSTGAATSVDLDTE